MMTERYLSREELAATVGITQVRLTRLVHLGVVEGTTPEAREFTVTTAARLKRMLRLNHDLGVDLADAAIVVDLLERIDVLERELRGLRGHRDVQEHGDRDIEEKNGGSAWTPIA